MKIKTKINPKYSQLGSFIERIHDAFEQEGQIIFQGRNVIKSFVLQVDGKEQTVIVKRYKRSNFFQKIGYSFFRSTKACRAYENAIELMHRGFSTPEPYGYVETRKNGFIDYCYFVSDVDDSHPISEQLNDIEEFNQVMAKDYARFVAQLHQKGILDIDLNSGNVLFHPLADGHYTFSLIDINRMKFYGENECPPLSECMENLTRFTGRMDVFECVARAYVKARGMSEGMVQRFTEAKIVHDRNWKRRKAITHLFK